MICLRSHRLWVLEPELTLWPLGPGLFLLYVPAHSSAMKLKRLLRNSPWNVGVCSFQILHCTKSVTQRGQP